MPSLELPATAIHVPRPPLPTFDAVLAAIGAKGYTLDRKVWVIDRRLKLVDAIGAVRMALDPNYPDTYDAGWLDALFGDETVRALIAGFTRRGWYRYRDLPEAEQPPAYKLGLALAGRAT